MNKKIILRGVLIIFSLAAAFSLGRYTTPQQVDSTKNTSTDRDVHTEITEVKNPDGTVTRIIKRDTSVKTDTKEQVKNTSGTKSKIRVLGLAGYDFSTNKPTYGGLISKQIVGPLEVGVFGLTNGIIGVSAGLEF